MTEQDSLSERYGAPTPWRRRATWVGSVALGVVFLTWLGWVVLVNATPEVDSELVSFTVEDTSSVTAVVDVRLADDEVTASCRLRAFAEDHTIVGELSFVPDPSAGERITQVIRTERLATSVELLGCTAPGQPRPS